MSLVQVDRVTKAFTKGGHTIRPLEEASLTIERGEVVSVMGASGSGKSTLLNQIAGIDHPTSGRITVAGVEITGLSRTKLARWRAENIGYIFPTPNPTPPPTGSTKTDKPP